MMDKNTSLDNKPASHRWFWFITLYLTSLIVFSFIVGLLHYLIPH